MRSTATRLMRAIALAGVALASTTGLAAEPAHASTPEYGRVCMFNRTKAVGTLGHVGWAIKVRGQKDHYFFGATEDPGQTWYAGGTWAQVYSTFKRHPFHGHVLTYNRYRCVTTRDGDVTAALRAYVRTKPGYNLFTNNCLTKSLSIIKAYSRVLANDRRLVPGDYTAPNYYFAAVLNTDHWERIHPVR
ncbi:MULTISPECIES: hypothetical protein [Streptomyces]|uniref:DUF4105 domain-containing protein n=1 Tax=Streptomyces fodineus TaxID=1904616 RepID=A0A1D7YD24_9ACTN|nr:hypothetical protein [Streptomyces fodineus]AOR33406.1 hypothetical protein BFF78_22135 [Streptomyces fodineus]